MIADSSNTSASNQPTNATPSAPWPRNSNEAMSSLWSTTWRQSTMSCTWKTMQCLLSNEPFCTSMQVIKEADIIRSSGWWTKCFWCWKTTHSVHHRRQNSFPSSARGQLQGLWSWYHGDFCITTVDVGAKVFIMRDNLYHKHFLSYPLNPAQSTLQAYDDTIIRVLGTITVPVNYRGIKLNNFTFYVAKGKSLMGVNLFDKLGFKLWPERCTHPHVCSQRQCVQIPVHFPIYWVCGV